MKKQILTIKSIVVILSIGSLLSSCTTAPKIEKINEADIFIARDSAKTRASFYEMHLGLFAHYMYPGVPYLGEHQTGNSQQYMWGATEWADGSTIKSLDELADNFDAEDFAATARSMRAQYIIFTTSHANMNVLFPSEVIKRYLPGHFSHRDVLRDLIKTVKAKNIRVMFYIHPSDGHDFSKEDKDRVGWNDGSPYKRWNDFINEYYAELVDRYGKDVSGYYIDGGLPNKYVDAARLRKTILSRQPGAWLVQNSGLEPACVDYGSYENLEHPYPADGRIFSSARLLKNNHNVDLKQTDNSVTLTLKQEDQWDEVDTIIVLE